MKKRAARKHLALAVYAEAMLLYLPEVCLHLPITL